MMLEGIRFIVTGDHTLFTWGASSVAIEYSALCGSSSSKTHILQTEDITTQAIIMITYKCTKFYFNTRHPLYKYGMPPMTMNLI